MTNMSYIQLLSGVVNLMSKREQLPFDLTPLWYKTMPNYHNDHDPDQFINV